MITLKSVIFTTILLKLLRFSESYMVTIDSGAQDCFHEFGPKLSLMFEVIEGGFNDIELRITDPQGKVIHEGTEKSGKYTFGSGEPEAKYTYCFINEKVSMSPKTIMFNMDVLDGGRVAGAPNESEVGHNKLEDMIRELGAGLTSVKHEQEYMHVRDKFHREVNESTNSRVVLWSTFEALVLVIMTVGQVYYLKRFFEVRRVV